MKTILCYGDSNTWGYNPKQPGRYPKPIRWTTVLQENLGSDFEVIAEGLNGRTTVWDDPI
ncbi:MAG TPA: G-D-S-L family lipolytic protein, partial [Clostridiales bacterium]|nr:G-D-S-L family lipolytic protein [Clostridiales bacterium]